MLFIFAYNCYALVMSITHNKSRLTDLRQWNLQELMRIQRLTRSDVAKNVGVSQAAISQYATGSRPMNDAICTRIEEAFALTEGHLSLIHGGSEVPPDSGLGVVFGLSLEGLQPLHFAVVDAFAKLARAGMVEDEQCIDMLNAFNAAYKGESAPEFCPKGLREAASNRAQQHAG